MKHSSYFTMLMFLVIATAKVHSIPLTNSTSLAGEENDDEFIMNFNSLEWLRSPCDAKPHNGSLLSNKTTEDILHLGRNRTDFWNMLNKYFRWQIWAVSNLMELENCGGEIGVFPALETIGTQTVGQMKETWKYLGLLFHFYKGMAINWEETGPCRFEQDHYKLAFALHLMAHKVHMTMCYLMELNLPRTNPNQEMFNLLKDVIGERKVYKFRDCVSRTNRDCVVHKHAQKMMDQLNTQRPII